MDNEITHLDLPLTADAARQLKLGQRVTVTGSLFTGRSRFHIRAIRDGIVPGLDYTQINCFFHVGPVMRQLTDGWEVVSAEPTSSLRFERYGAAVVRKLGLRTLIGKTTMGPATAAALAEVGGVFLSKIGLCGNRLARQVRRVRDVYFLDELGKTEATWIFEVERLGPFFVALDARGNSYFEQLDQDVQAALPRVHQGLGIPADFAYTRVDGG